MITQSMKKVAAIALISAMIFQPINAENQENKPGLGSKVWNITKIGFGSLIAVLGIKSLTNNIFISTDEIVQQAAYKAKERGLLEEPYINRSVVTTSRVIAGGVDCCITYLGYRIIKSGINGLKDEQKDERAQSTWQ